MGPSGKVLSKLVNVTSQLSNTQRGSTVHSGGVGAPKDLVN